MVESNRQHWRMLDGSERWVEVGADATVRPSWPPEMPVPIRCNTTGIRGAVVGLAAYRDGYGLQCGALSCVSAYNDTLVCEVWRIPRPYRIDPWEHGQPALLEPACRVPASALRAVWAHRYGQMLADARDMADRVFLRYGPLVWPTFLVAGAYEIADSLRAATANRSLRRSAQVVLADFWRLGAGVGTPPMPTMIRRPIAHAEPRLVRQAAAHTTGVELTSGRAPSTRQSRAGKRGEISLRTLREAAESTHS